MAKNGNGKKNGNGNGCKGRYSRALADRILERLASGRSLRSIANDDDVPVHESTIRYWVVDDKDGFAARYARARDVYVDAMADEIIAISDGDGNETPDFVIDEKTGKRVMNPTVQRDRLRSDNRKWYVSKLAPKKYGDRLQVDQDVNLSFGELTDAQLEERIVGFLGKIGALPK